MDPFSSTIITTVAVGVTALVVSELVRLPSIVFLLTLGVVLGQSGLGLIDPGALGDSLNQGIRLAVVVILFEGALSLNFAQLRGIATGPIRNLLSIGALVTWFGAAAAARWIAGLDWPVALLFGSIMIVTGPTVIGPILRRVRLKPGLANILQWEGVLIDPIGAVVSVVLLEYYLSQEPSITGTLVNFFFVLGGGTVVGLIVGFAGGAVLRNRSLWPVEEEHSGNLFALAMALAAFGLGELVRHEAGIMAATVVGMVLGNMKLHNIEDLQRFGGQVSNLMVAGLFLVLAAGIDLEALRGSTGMLFGVVAAVALVVRPINIFVSTAGSEISMRGKLFLSWISPRGVVAASVASLINISLPENRFEGTELLEALVFLTIATTVLAQGLSAGFVAKALGVAQPERRGFLIIGAHALGMAIGKALRQQGITVVMVDTNLTNCIRARMEGLEAVKGNALDGGFLTKVLDPAIGNLLALTANDEVNALACVAARPFLGSSTLWRAVNETGSDVSSSTEVPGTGVGAVAFAESFDIMQLSRAIASGVQSIDIHEMERDFELPREIPADSKAPFPLLEIDGARIRVLTPGAKLAAGDKTIALSPMPERVAG